MSLARSTDIGPLPGMGNVSYDFPYSTCWLIRTTGHKCPLNLKATSYSRPSWCSGSWLPEAQGPAFRSICCTLADQVDRSQRRALQCDGLGPAATCNQMGGAGPAGEGRNGMTMLSRSAAALRTAFHKSYFAIRFPLDS